MILTNVKLFATPLLTQTITTLHQNSVVLMKNLKTTIFNAKLSKVTPLFRMTGLEIVCKVLLLTRAQEKTLTIIT